MAMSEGLIGLVTLIYLIVAGNELRQVHYGQAAIYAGYAFANVGLIATMKGFK
jgi:hypothetical protein